MGMGHFMWTAHSKSPLPFYHLQWLGASRQLYEAHLWEDPPQRSLPQRSHAHPVSPRHGCAQLFSKRLCFIFQFPKHQAFQNGTLLLQHCCNSHGILTSLHWAICGQFPIHKTAQDAETVAST